MKLYMTVSAVQARQIIDDGFVGIPTQMTHEDGTERVCEFVMMRDRPPCGTVRWGVSGGTSVIDDPGDFNLVIDVPDDMVMRVGITEDPPRGWPFREYWLPAEVINAHRNTMVIVDTDGGEEVQPDFVGR